MPGPAVLAVLSTGLLFLVDEVHAPFLPFRELVESVSAGPPRCVVSTGSPANTGTAAKSVGMLAARASGQRTARTPASAAMARRRGRLCDGRIGCGLRSHLEQLASGGLDVGRRGRAPDPRRACSLRRARTWLDRPRAALHSAVHLRPLCLSGPSLRVHVQRLLSAHGPARSPEGKHRHLQVALPGAGGCAGTEAVRDDPRRQRLALVHLRRPQPALERRRPAPA